MAITKAQKQKIIEDLKDKIDRQKAMVFLGIGGIKVKDLSELRKQIKENGKGALKVVKNTLTELALKDKKLDFSKKNFKEEMALIFGFEDETSSAKTAYLFSLKNDKLKILGGIVENKLLASEEMIALAQLPGKGQLLAMLVGSIKAPVNNFVYALNYNLKGLVQVLSKIKT